MKEVKIEFGVVVVVVVEKVEVVFFWYFSFDRNLEYSLCLKWE